MISTLLAAVFAAMDGDAALKTLLEAGRGAPLSAPLPIYPTKAPPDEPLPYITFNTVAEPSWDTSDSIGADVRFDIHGYAATEAEARALVERAAVLFTDPSLSLAGLTLIHCRRVDGRCDPDGEGFHGVATIRTIISQ